MGRAGGGGGDTAPRASGRRLAGLALGVRVVGELALWIALFLAVWGSAASFAGAWIRRPELVESGTRAILASVPMLGLALAGVVSALLRHDFALAYVARHTATNMPAAYLVTAIWAGPEGSLLAWAFAASVFAAIAVRPTTRHPFFAGPRIAGILAAVLGLAVALVCFAVNPYDPVEWVPAEGAGLTPALQRSLAAPHFAALYAAYAAAVVPVARVAGARGGDARWRTAVERWTLLAWSLLTVGMALGMRWRYGLPAFERGGWHWDGALAANVVLWIVGAAIARAAAARRPGAMAMYAVYAGVVVALVGVAAQRAWTEETVRLSPGQSAELRDPFGNAWRLVSQGLSRDEAESYLSTGVAVEARRGGEAPVIVNAERRQHVDGLQRTTSEPTAVAGIRSSLALDLYVVLAGVRGEVAELRVGFRPLVSCVWIGWLLIVAGAVTLALRSAVAKQARSNDAASVEA